MATGTIKQVYKSWRRNELVVYAGALSFYVLLAIGPLILILFALAAYILDPIYLNNILSEYLQVIIGIGGKNLVFDLVEVAQISGRNILRFVIAVAILLISVTRIFNVIQRSLEKIWNIDTVKSFRKSFGKKIQSVFLVFFLATTILLSVVLHIILNILIESLRLGSVILQILLAVLTLVMLWIMFASVYKVLPDEKLPWNVVLKGGAITSAFFYFGQFLFIFYFQKVSGTTTNTAVESLLALIIWIYYSSLCFLIGAQTSKEIYSKVIRK